MPDERKQRKKLLALVLAFAASAGLLVAAFTNRWLATTDGDAGMGLRNVEVCGGEHCVTMTNDEVIAEIEREIVRTKEANKLLPPNRQMALPRSPWSGWPMMGLSAFLASLVAAGGLLAGAALALAGKRPVLPVMPTTLAVLGLIIAIITGCLFIATKPDESQVMGVGWSFMTFGGAIVVGLAAVFPLNRLIRPIDEELGEASATMSWGSSRDDE